MNSVNLVGRITTDLKLEITNTNKGYLKFNVAVRRDKDNTDFINCIAWNQTANLIEEYCKKGGFIGINGTLRIDRYEKENEKKKNIYVLVNGISFIEGKNKEEKKETKNNEYEIEEINEDEFPF